MQRRYFALYSLFVLASVALTFGIAPDPNVLKTYNLSEAQVRLLSLGILIPVFAIWFAAFYGFSALKTYTAKISRDSDGAAFNKIANGLMIYAIGLPVDSLLSTALNYAARDDLSLIPNIVVFNNYVVLAIQIAAFYLIFLGAKDLAKLSSKTFVAQKNLLTIILFGILGLVYIFAVLQNPHNRAAPTPTTQGTYYLDDWAIALTVLVPYLYVWYIGLQSARCIMFFRSKTKGVIYREGLHYLAYGIGTVIIMSIVAQLLKLFGQGLAGLSIAALLAIIYVLLAMISVGFVLIALGAKRLRKIEEVL